MPILREKKDWLLIVFIFKKKTGKRTRACLRSREVHFFETDPGNTEDSSFIVLKPLSILLPPPHPNLWKKTKDKTAREVFFIETESQPLLNVHVFFAGVIFENV